MIYKQGPEYQSGKRPYNNKLQREGHDKIFAVCDKIVRYKILCKAISVVYAKDACKSYLPYNGKCLDGKDDKNGSVPRLNDPECTAFGKMAGYKIGKQCNDYVFNPHFFQGG